MTRPIEAIIAEALQRLETSGHLDVSAFAAAHPEHAGELRELLPAMLDIHTERRWQEVAAASRAYAVSLFGQLSPPPTTALQTLGTLLAHEREQSGLTVAEQSRRAGLTPSVIEQLSTDQTPVGALDNAAIKQLSVKVAAPFAALVREVRRLLTLEALSGASPQAVLTRDKETSSDTEKQLLMKKVREAASRKPQTPPRKPKEPE